MCFRSTSFVTWFDATCWKLPSAMNRSLTCFLVVIVKLPTIPNSVVDSVSDDVERFVAIKIILGVWYCLEKNPF